MEKATKIMQGGYETGKYKKGHSERFEGNSTMQRKG
jgi:hypothetical protein